MRSTIVLLVAAVVTAAGCALAEMEQRPEISHPLAPRQTRARRADYLQNIAVEKEPTQPKTPTAVEDALQWSRKYAQATEELHQERQKSRALEEENRRLREQIAELEGDLTQAQQELEEANTLLIEVRSENEKWRKNILGYRDEMRRSHLTELEALAKVLKLLGAEIAETSPAVQDEAIPVEEAPTQAEGGIQGESSE